MRSRMQFSTGAARNVDSLIDEIFTRPSPEIVKEETTLPCNWGLMRNPRL